MIYTGWELTKRSEGLRLVAYKDGGGVLTIGYGHTKGVKSGDTCTEDQANQWLKSDVQWAVDAVNSLVKIPLTQQQFDALVDFVFNLGKEQFQTSTLLKLLNSGDYMGAYKEFPKWDKDNGKVVKGLQIRRAAEAELFIHK